MKVSICMLLVVAILGFVSISSEAAAPAPTGVTADSVTGTVLETMDAAGCTYMRLKTPHGEIWAAVQKANVKKGSEVTVVNGAPMNILKVGPSSGSLTISFSGILALKPGCRGPFTAPPRARGSRRSRRKQLSPQHAGLAQGPPDSVKIAVKKAEGAEGKTVARSTPQGIT